MDVGASIDSKTDAAPSNLHAASTAEALAPTRIDASASEDVARAAIDDDARPWLFGAAAVVLANLCLYALLTTIRSEGGGGGYRSAPMVDVHDVEARGEEDGAAAERRRRKKQKQQKRRARGEEKG